MYPNTSSSRKSPETMKRQKRWYEKNPLTREAMEIWRDMPHPIRRGLGKFIFNICTSSRAYREGRLDSVPNMFPELYLMFRKRRWYDQDPIVRKAFIAMGYTSHREIVWLAERIVVLKKLLEQQALDGDYMSEDQIDRMLSSVFARSH